MAEADSIRCASGVFGVKVRVRPIENAGNPRVRASTARVVVVELHFAPAERFSIRGMSATTGESLQADSRGFYSALPPNRFSLNESLELAWSAWLRLGAVRKECLLHSRFHQYGNDI